MQDFGTSQIDAQPAVVCATRLRSAASGFCYYSSLLPLLSFFLSLSLIHYFAFIATICSFSIMLRQRSVLASQAQSLRGISRRGPYSLLRTSSTGSSPPPIDDESLRKIGAILAQSKKKATHARQSTHNGTYAALRSKVTSKRILLAYIAFALIVSYAYEPLRDRGVFGDIADATIFHVIPPKLVEPPDGDRAGETIYKPIT